MIIKAHSRKDAADLARYLLTQKSNQQAYVIDIRGSASDDLKISLTAWEEAAFATTRAKFPLYHLSVRLAPGETLTMDQWMKALETVEAKMQMANHARAIVGHVLNGELHLNVVYNRLRPDRPIVRNMSHDRRAHHSTAREMEREFNLRELQSSRVIGRNGNEKTRSAEHRVAKEAKINRQELCDRVKEAWLNSKTGREFEMNLAKSDIIMARGERRDYVLNFAGKTFSPVRLLEYVRAKEFRAKMEIDPPTLEAAKSVPPASAELTVERVIPAPTRRVAHEMTSAEWKAASGQGNEQRSHQPTTVQPIPRRAAGMLPSEFDAVLNASKPSVRHVEMWEEFLALNEKENKTRKVDHEPRTEEHSLDR